MNNVRDIIKHLKRIDSDGSYSVEAEQAGGVLTIRVVDATVPAEIKETEDKGTKKKAAK
jgi:hypothetical protein